MKDKTVTLRNDEPCLDLDNTTVWRNPAEPPTKVSKKKKPEDKITPQPQISIPPARDIPKATLPPQYQQSRYRNTTDNQSGYQINNTPINNAGFDPDKTVGVGSAYFDPERIKPKNNEPNVQPQYTPNTYNDHYQDDYTASDSETYNDKYNYEQKPKKSKRGCGCFISVILIIAIITGGAFAVWHFFLKPKPTDNDLFNSKLVPVCKTDKWGYMNKKGEKVVSLRYEEAYDFSDELALVKKDGKYGYIDKKGKEVIECKYEEAYSFNEGLAVVKKGNYYGCINKDGEMKINAKYHAIGNYHEGYAHVRIDGKSGFIDTEGDILLPLSYDYAYDFSEGYAHVVLDGKHGFIDTDGDIFIKWWTHNRL